MSVSVRTRALLHERAHGCCEICGSHGATNAHHRQNRSQGGSDRLANLLLLCGSGTTGCHGTVTKAPVWADQLGYTVKRDQSAAGKAVWRWSREAARNEWVLLDDEGTLTPALMEIEA